MTTNAFRNIAALAAGLCLLGGCAGNKGSEAISTDSGSTSASSTWEGDGKSAPKSGGRKVSRAQEQLDQFRSDPTPELDTLAQRPDDIKNAMTVVNDTNLRLLTEDFGRFWFYERPSRLTPTTIPH